MFFVFFLQSRPEIKAIIHRLAEGAKWLYLSLGDSPQFAQKRVRQAVTSSFYEAPKTKTQGGFTHFPNYLFIMLPGQGEEARTTIAQAHERSKAIEGEQG